LDGLVLTPVGGQGRGPLRHGAHAEVVATAGEAARRRGGHCRWRAVRSRGGRRRWRAVGVEVVAAAGEPLGAEVAAAAGEPLGASYPRDPTGVEVVHTYRVEMELGLCLKADVILLLFVRYF
jgi:hypothetical protein